MKCIRKLFRSCAKKSNQVERDTTQISPGPVTDRTFNNTPIINNTTFSTPLYPYVNEMETSQPPKSLARVHSHVDVSKIQSNETKRKENKDIKFNCPICLLYFDSILTTKCCNNYICHFCIEKMNEKTLSEAKTIATKCPFCETASLILDDVDPQVKPKRYSDSPSSTFGPGKPFIRDNFKLDSKDTLDHEALPPVLRHKYSKSINNYVGSNLIKRRKSDGNLKFDQTKFSSVNSRDDRTNSIMNLSQQEEETHIVQGSRLRSANAISSYERSSPIKVEYPEHQRNKTLI